MKLGIGSLHILTDVRIQKKYSHLDIARMALEGGADTIQLRDKDGNTSELLRIAADLRKICSDNGVPFIVNDRVDIAYEVDADGVHLGQNDLPILTARKILGEGKIIGVSATTLEQAMNVVSDGGDYVGFGPVFPTKSKDNPDKVKGVEYLRKVASTISLPVVAIGGINPMNLEEVLHTGCHGVAVISAVCCAPDPVSAVRLLREKFTLSRGG